MHATLTKKQMATIQIERAIICYKTDQDFVSALTLAGAVDSMLGEALRVRGKQNALEEDIWLVQKIERISGSPESKAKDWITYLNTPRNELKHWKDPNVSELTCNWKDRAEDMIDRAVKNYIAFYRDATDSMSQFIRDIVDSRD